MKKLLIAVLLFVSILTVVSCSIGGGVDLGMKISSKPETGLAIRCKFGERQIQAWRQNRIWSRIWFYFGSIIEI